MARLKNNGVSIIGWVRNNCDKCGQCEDLNVFEISSGEVKKYCKACFRESYGEAKKEAVSSFK